MNDDDSIDLECPYCLQRLRVPAETAGKKIRCPDCSAAIEVPGQTGITEESRTPQSRKPQPEPLPYGATLPYDDDTYLDKRPLRRRGSTATGGVMASAICMLVVGGLGLLLNLLGCVLAAGPDQPVDPQAPPLVQEFMKGTHGPIAVATQGSCALLSGITILGSVQMLRRKMWGLGLTASIISMLNFGNCCCLFGLPVGLWALIVLANADVRDGFS